MRVMKIKILFLEINLILKISSNLFNNNKILHKQHKVQIIKVKDIKIIKIKIIFIKHNKLKIIITKPPETTLLEAM
jgi:hypothetical protein